MTIFDDIGRVAGEIARSIQNADVFGLIGIIFAIMIVLVVGVLFLIAIVKIFKKGTEYVQPTHHLGTFKIGIRDKSYLTGNLNKDDTFLVGDIFNRMKNEPRIKSDAIKSDGIRIMEDLWKNDLLYAYDMKVFESFKSDLPDNKIKILSPVPIEDNSISWQDEKGEWSITGSPTSLFKRYPRNVTCSELTEYIDVKDIHGFKKRVYILAPYSRVVNEKLMANPKGQVIKDVLKGKQAFVNLINLPNKQALATLAVFIPSLNDLYKELEIRQQELENVKKQRDEYNQLADDQRMEIEGYKARLKTHPLYGDDRPMVPIQPQSLLGLVAGCVFAGYIATKIGSHDYFVQYNGLFEYLFVGGTAIVAIFLIKMFEKKKEREQKFGIERPGATR